MASPNPKGRRASTRVAKADAIENLITGLGSAVDKSAANVIGKIKKWSVGNADIAWSSSTIIERVIESPVLDVIRTGYYLPPGSKPEAMLLHQSFTSVLREALQYDRAYGGSAILAIVEGAEVSEPLDKIPGGLFRCIALTPEEYKPGVLDSDPFSPTFRQPTLYEVGKAKVHPSRMITIGYQESAGRAQLAYESVASYLAAIQSVGTLIADFAQAVFKIKGLAEILTTNDRDTIKARVAAMDSARSVLRAILIDGDSESFERQSTNLGGLPEAVHLLCERMAADCEMPLSMLLGQTPAGLNSSGESDHKYWTRTLQRVQAVATPAVAWHFGLIELALGELRPGVVEWNDLMPASVDQELDRAAKQAAIDDTYLQGGVLTPEQIIQRLTGEGSI